MKPAICVPIRILHVIISLNAGGAEHMLCKLIENRDMKKFETTVLSLTNKGFYADRIEKSGVKIIDLELGFTFRCIKKIIMVMKMSMRNNFDVYQGWMYHGNIIAYFLHVISSKSKLFWNIRQSINNWNNEKVHAKIFIKIGAILSRQPESIINNSIASIKEHELIGFEKGKQKYIPNGFNIESVQCNNRPSIRENILVIKFCTVARFHPNKGHKVLLESFKIYLEKRPAVLVLVGTDCDSSNELLINTIKEFGLTDYVVLMGERKDVNQILREIDCFILPSVGVEGFPNALGEAMLAKKLCIATDIGECQAMLKGIGWIVEPGNTKALVNAMIDVSNMSNGEYLRRGNLSEEKIIRNYNIEDITKKYELLWLNSQNITG